jgi:polyisoprenoid-binding protein YceI
MTRRFLNLTLLVCAAVPLNAIAAQRAVILDPAKSSVSFTLDTTFHLVHGTMALTGGTIRFDTETGEATGEITVDACAAETGNKGRDETMHADVLETAKYPTIVFKPKRVEGVLADPGRSELRIVGTMSLHGADHPMTLTAMVECGQGNVRGELRIPVPYVEWGLKDPSFLVARAAKTVDILVKAEGRWDR